MKENEAPDKIYCGNNGHGNLSYSNQPFSNAVEYTRTDAFIEKACEYISEHVEYYMKKDKACNVPLCPLFATKGFIENFKKYMEGE